MQKKTIIFSTLLSFGWAGIAMEKAAEENTVQSDLEKDRRITALEHTVEELRARIRESELKPLKEAIERKLQEAKKFYWGKEIPRDYCKARELFQQVADQDIDKLSKAWAHVWLARIYTYGCGIGKDLSLAYTFFKHAADQNDNRNAQLWAFVGLGHIHYGNKEYTKAKVYFDRGENQNIDPHAKAFAWAWYANWHNEVEKDLQKVFFYAKRAAEQTYNEEAQAIGWVILARMYLLGEVVPQDFAKAKEYLKRAETQSNLLNARLNAKLELAVSIYLKGPARDCDYDKAFVYIKALAAQQEEPYIQVLAWTWLCYMHSEGYGTLKNPSKALEWAKRVAEQDAFKIEQAWALKWMVEYYLSSYQYCLINDYLLKAFEQTSDRGVQLWAAYLFSHLHLQSGNVVGAWCVYCIAVEQPYAPLRAWGFKKIGDMYYEGNGYEKNHRKAFKYYKGAESEKENAIIQAQVKQRLGEIYCLGKEMKTNFDIALEYFGLVADQTDDLSVQAEGYEWLSLLCFEFLEDEKLGFQYLELALKQSNNEKVATWAKNELKVQYPDKYRKRYVDECVIL